MQNKAIVANKDEKEWVKIDESYIFKFSMFMDDLIKVTKGDKVIFGYFSGTDRSTSSITLEAQDRSALYRSIGVKTQDEIQKFAVDPLGNITEIKHEIRLSLTNVKSNQQRIADRKARREKVEQAKAQE